VSNVAIFLDHFEMPKFNSFYFYTVLSFFAPMKSFSLSDPYMVCFSCSVAPMMIDFVPFFAPRFFFVFVLASSICSYVVVVTVYCGGGYCGYDACPNCAYGGGCTG